MFDLDIPALMPPRIDARGDSNYEPCSIGLHLCGIVDDGEREQPYTALNLPAPNREAARSMFIAAKAVAEALGDEWDFICDLNLSHNDRGVDDFGLNRQMVPALVRAPIAAKQVSRQP